ncbi:hypothetical protein ACJ41O_015160 [Fusarium nematophilum]
MGKEFKSKGANIALAPAAGPLGRSAYSGRNWEGFSPDPYLSGIGVEESVKGLQDAGVQATAKHCILNEQEGNRNPKTVNGTSYSSISTNADDRTVHEVYLWPFANAVRANCATFMCSYQRINGSYACQNSKIINGLLNWYAVHSGLASLAAGLDLEMPGHLNFGALLTGLPGQPLPAWFGGIVTMGVNNGTIDTERLDDMVTRVMMPFFALRQHQDFPSVDSSVSRLGFYPRHTWLRTEEKLGKRELRPLRSRSGLAGQRARRLCCKYLQ